MSEERAIEVSDSLAAKLQAVIEEEGLGDYQIEEIELTEKTDKGKAGILPGCRMECKVRGFPPKLKCKLVCG